MNRQILISFVFLFIVIGIQSYCQNPSDSVKVFMVEKTILHHGKTIVKSKKFSKFQKVKVELKNGSKFHGYLSDIKDPSFSVGKKKDIKITEVKKISKYGSSALLIAGASIATAGIALSAYKEYGWNPYYTQGMAMIPLGGLVAIVGNILKNKSNYTIDKGWKIKIKKIARPVYN